MELLNDINKIEAWLNEHQIKNYIIREDLSIDVDDKVDLRAKNLKGIPVQFNIVSGFFDCSENELVTLKGCPKNVKGNFLCKNNSLVNLVGGPVTAWKSYICSDNKIESLLGVANVIGEHFHCNNNNLKNLDFFPSFVGTNIILSHNQLVSLKGAPQVVEGDFYCDNNQLLNLFFGPEEVDLNFSCEHNKITTLEGCPLYIGLNFTLNSNPIELGDLHICKINHIGSNIYMNNNTPLDIMQTYDFLNSKFATIKPFLMERFLELSLLGEEKKKTKKLKI